jgi:hypothetical protein
MNHEHIDLVYFWSSILIVALPLTVFGVLAYLVVRAYLKKEQGAKSKEQNASS